LFHLIDKVENSEVNTTQIESFLPNIYEKLSNFSREELIQKFVSLEFNSFLSYYENAPDLNNMSSRDRDRDRDGGRSSGRRGYSDENMTRFFINLGRKDRLNPAKLMGLINEQGLNKNVSIGAIDILDTFSFFEIDKDYESQTLDAFAANNPEFNGRRVNVEITKTDRKGGGRRRGGGNRRNNRDRDSSRGFGRSRNNGGKPQGRRDKKDFGRSRKNHKN